MGEERSTVTIYVMGKAYEVPASLTIMKAMEYIGYRFVRGAGCRAGFCGACATLYRKKGSYKLEAALACQKVVEDGMYIATIPFAPAEKRTYDINKLRPTPNVLLEYYPEIARCLSCNTCTKACPQDLQVMDYVQAAIRGDIEEVARLSFDCLSCGLCAMRCPAEIVPYNVAQLARRLYAKYLAKTSEHLMRRLKEIEEGKFDEELKRLKGLSREELKELYDKREIRV
ncbi:4Fe-4S ferredoxin [Candidatus Bathyarchaeota archaeon]|nr:MAG: 4Fe-4S dicluster domain-containing protein [Candidatus Bathyarchaeota archaeon]RLI33797.1 MAG: 4Fe-4S ferredoxin [Candidatus Bathyarchaeota archaeon]